MKIEIKLKKTSGVLWLNWELRVKLRYVKLGFFGIIVVDFHETKQFSYK